MYRWISQLKALSIEIDLDESGINRQVFFKGRGVDIFGKIHPFLILAPPCTLIGNYDSNCQHLQANNPHIADILYAQGGKVRWIHCASSYC